MAETVVYRLSPGRKAWMEHLLKVGTSNARPRGRVGRDCMRLGWTEWARDSDGEIIGEKLTAEGISILKNPPKDTK